jgi:parvulin-like peptidyl-prolyl isomerase
MIACAALVLAGFLVLAPVSADPPRPAPAAVVNGEEISLAEVDAYIRNALGIVPITDSQRKQLRATVVSDLVDDRVLKQFLTKNAPKVEAADLDKHLTAFAKSLQRRGKTLAEYLKETNQTEIRLRETWTVMLQLDGLVKKTITEDQLKQYYLANKDAFDGVEVKASHIMLAIGRNASALEKTVSRKKLEVVRAEITAKKLEFAAAARKYSQDPTAELGGDLGFIPRKGAMDELFCKAAFALKPGEISTVVETEFGLHLILVAERKPGKPSQFEKCIDEVRELFADDYRIELTAKLRKEAQVKIMLP